MDNSNQTPQMPTPNMSPSQPSVPQTLMPDSSSGDSNKMILWLLIGLVIVVALVGGIYLFLSKQQTSAPKSQITPLQTPVTLPQENLENDLRSIDVEGEIDSDFTPVDQDLGQL